MKNITVAKPHYQCQNCLAFWKEEDLKEIEHIFGRIPRGEIMPAVECPACGAACHEVDNP